MVVPIRAKASVREVKPRGATKEISCNQLGSTQSRLRRDGSPPALLETLRVVLWCVRGLSDRILRTFPPRSRP